MENIIRPATLISVWILLLSACGADQQNVNPLLSDSDTEQLVEITTINANIISSGLATNIATSSITVQSDTLGQAYLVPATIN
jgi:hypothetical protein